jgi:transmembrane sensor
MKKILNIFKNKKTIIDPEFNLDEVLNQHNIEYSEIDFKTYETDTLISLKTINNSINNNSNFLKNIKSAIPFINYKAILKPIYTAALTAIIIFAAIELNKTKDPVQYAEVSVDAGEKITLHITNDITVWLNSESSIKIPLEIKKNSKFYVEGEAYFEINQKRKKKLEVVCKNIEFTANSASFYINSNENVNELTAKVEEGEVELYNPLLPESTKLMLNKGDKATYNSVAEFIATETDNNINYLAWKTGLLHFNETALNEVISSLSEHFDIPVIIENKDLNNKLFTATFTNADIDEILDKIQDKFNCKISADGNNLIIN